MASIPSPSSGGSPIPGAMCAFHSGRSAGGICSRCGDFICSECVRLADDGNTLCPRCAANAPTWGEPIAWERRAELGIVGGFLQTIKGFFIAPVETLRGIHPHGPWFDAIIFILIVSLFNALGTGAQTFAQYFAMGTFTEGELGQVGDVLGGGLIGGLAVIVLVPISMILSSFIIAGVVHIACRIVGTGDGGYRGTYRMLAYTQSLYAVSGALSLVGGLIGAWHLILYSAVYLLIAIVQMGLGVYVLVLWVFGIREVHRTTTGRAIGAVAVTFGVGLLLCCGLYILAFGLVFAALGVR